LSPRLPSKSRIPIRLAIYTIYAATRFFPLKQDAPKVMIRLYLANMVAALLELLCVTFSGAEFAIADSAGTLLRAVAVGVIWIWHFSVSKRVAETFVA
jgi:hypothetical protein